MPERDIVAHGRKLVFDLSNALSHLREAPSRDLLIGADGSQNISCRSRTSCVHDLIQSYQIHAFGLLRCRRGHSEHFIFQPIFAWLKSISGCCCMNFCNISCFFCSSLVGFPCLFISWSYIIFSTMPRVSPSRSPSFEFSGTIFEVSILGAVVTMCAHQCEFGDLARLMTISFEPSLSVDNVHVESSTTIGCGKLPCVRVSDC